MLGERIRQARLAAGLTVRGLAEKVGVSHSAISKYEIGEDRPRQSVLLAIAQALHVRTSFFLKPTEVELAVVEFRRKASFSDAKADQVRARVQVDLQPYIELSEIWAAGKSGRTAHRLPTPKTMVSLDAVETFAEHVRGEWQIGLAPITNVIELVESVGVKVLTTNAGDGFDEMAGIANGEYPVVVVKNLDEGKGDRQRFDVLHGLGHLLLRPGDGIDKEKMCHRFAAAMLVPRTAAIRCLGSHRRTLDLDFELQQLKREYGLSIKGWIGRACDLGIVSSTACTNLYKQLSWRHWNKDEPVKVLLETPTHFRKMVYQARAEGIITEVRAAEYLGELSAKRLKSVRTEDIPQSAITDYSAGGALHLDTSYLIEETASE